jgi:hypothetical protein
VVQPPHFLPRGWPATLAQPWGWPKPPPRAGWGWPRPPPWPQGVVLPPLGPNPNQLPPLGPQGVFRPPPRPNPNFFFFFFFCYSGWPNHPLGSWGWLHPQPALGGGRPLPRGKMGWPNHPIFFKNLIYFYYYFILYFK